MAYSLVRESEKSEGVRGRKSDVSFAFIGGCVETVSGGFRQVRKSNVAWHHNTPFFKWGAGHQGQPSVFYARSSQLTQFKDPKSKIEIAEPLRGLFLKSISEGDSIILHSNFSISSPSARKNPEPSIARADAHVLKQFCYRHHSDTYRKNFAHTPMPLLKTLDLC